MTGKNETFVMDDYGKKSTFASFLPGIAGIRGIPIWCYYVNRGQCVVSFGVDNKDHGILSGASGISECKDHRVSHIFKEERYGF